jgi:topoisomerase-4 subunit A
MTVDEGDTPIVPCIYEDAPGNFVAALSEGGRLLLFAIGELKYQPRGRGVIIMGLDEDDKLFAAAVSDQPRLIVKGGVRGGKEKEIELKQDKLAHHILKRARMGRVVSGVLKSAALIIPGKPDAN